ncbi:GNAT family N-acetyltransferase [Massilia sp. YIM B02769]|uniref:GNAT family N-acetyltransferase n=1 Tax=unclassified Massilia TaxID=2609279 RepID=UPI0025B65DEF|nr:MULTISPECIES: GNAT family N-acetyltransferase [unclassified Massilia]MDN4056749.1 GNAT family N-acetyltransferase [Massilia sp. YIM B02769]
MVDCAPVDPDAMEARGLIAELDAALAAICGDSGAQSFDANDVRGARSVFLLARDASGNALGCGALRPIDDDVAEVKRMYARPGSGAGVRLLGELERRALGFGYRAVWLETRKVNGRAVAFYERHGYRVIPNYGKYVGREDAVCLGKVL